MLRSICGFAFCCLIPTALPAQFDTIYAIPPVTIQDKPSVQTGYSNWHTDSIPQAGLLSLAERLLMETPVSVRANGPGILSTVSARGGGPARTAVIWQGLNLQSPMNGVVDIALLPLWPQDRVELHFGGQSAAQSTGTMAGAIHLIPLLLADSTGCNAQIAWSGGSFDRWNTQASLGLGFKQFRSTIRATWRQAENNFPFKNTALIGAPASRQVNNFSENFDLQQFNRLALNDKNSIETAVWHQRVFRELPPSMTEAPQLTWQRDRSTRAVATWINQPNKQAQWQHRLAWQDEFIAFNLSSDVDSSRAQTAMLSSEYWTAPIRRLSVRAGLTGWFQRAQADGYADSTNWFQQTRFAASLHTEYRWQRWRLSAQLRQEWAERQGAPFTWILGGQWDIHKTIFLHAHLSRNFNLPTFNDRFWRQLGNPDLRPEAGYSTDLGLNWSHKNLSAQLTVFQLLLDDWILWQPGVDGQFRPGNLRQVWSRGLEFSTAYALHFLKSQWKIKGRYQFVRASNTAVYGGNNGVLHKLLPYTPQHSAAASLRWANGPWSVVYLHQWTGPRFTDSDNASELPGFHTGNLMAQFSWRRITLDAALENVWNAAYQIIEYRPMPGRSWRAGGMWAF